MLDRDPDNALRFQNLSKWPPPTHLAAIRDHEQHRHLAQSRPALVLQWLKDTAAARPETRTRDGAVRYLLNTLKGTLATDYTRPGQPLPEDPQLKSETFQLIDHTLDQVRAAAPDTAVPALAPPLAQPPPPLSVTLAPSADSPAAPTPSVPPSDPAPDSAPSAQQRTSPPAEPPSPASAKRDDEFSIRLRSQVQKQKDLAAEIETALKAAGDIAARPDPATPEDALAEFAKNHAGISRQASEAFAQVYTELLKQLAPHRQFVADTVAALDRRMNNRATQADAAALTAATNKLADMAPHEAKMVLHLLNQAAAVRGRQVDKITGRVIAGLAQQAGEAPYRLWEDFAFDPRRRDEAVKNIKSSGQVTTVIKRITNPHEARLYVMEKTLDWINFPDPSGDNYRRDRGWNTRTLSPEETALIEEARQWMFRKQEMLTKFKDLGRLADPLGEDPLSVIAATAGTSVAIMGITALTQGTSVLVLPSVYSSATYDELRQKYPDADPAELSKIADLTGLIQAPMDLLALSLLKRLPGVKSLLAGAIEKSLLKRPFARLAGVYLGEQVTEGLQDVTPDALIQALKADIPGYDWNREMKEFWGSRWKVAIGTLPLTLLGLGAASWREVKNSRQMLANDTALGSLGLGDKDRSTIADLARTGRMDEALAALKEAMQRRDPAVAQQFQQQADAVAGQQAKAFQALMQQAGLTLTRAGHQYIITAPGGAKATFDTAEEAVEAIQAHLKEEGTVSDIGQNQFQPNNISGPNRITGGDQNPTQPNQKSESSSPTTGLLTPPKGPSFSSGASVGSNPESATSALSSYHPDPVLAASQGQDGKPLPIPSPSLPEAPFGSGHPLKLAPSTTAGDSLLLIPRKPRNISLKAQYGPPTPITGNRPTPPPLARFNTAGQTLTHQQIREEINKARHEGHADDRHGSQVTEGQLDLRATHGIDPMTQTKQDGVTGNDHRASKHATQFTSDRALVQARRAVEDSVDFKSQIAMGGDKIVIESVSLESALGLYYLDHVRGKSRVGTSSNPTGTVATDLTGGYLKAVYKKIKDTNQYELVTLYPDPK
ncbi:MAG TPA: hypothetical protein VD994_20030 [Prosthecobacter sp.]|nr:hypothetical protein [Prosthecobacter sp.]